jgi:hypothetical protein
MRVVTNAAGHPAGMLAGDYLRKSLRFGGVGFVTAYAQRGRIRFHRFMVGRVFGVPRRGAVAGLAVDVRVLAFSLRCSDVNVAEFAIFVSRKGDWLRPDVV